jgi:hypothetical protein
MPRIDWLKEIPELGPAIQREVQVREIVFANQTEQINGVEVFPMTPQHFVYLEGLRSPYTGGGAPDSEDAQKFIWIVSTKFTTHRNPWARHVFHHFLETTAAIDAYVRDSFQDVSGGKNNSNGDYLVAVAAIIDCFASEYGWTEEYIMGKPLKKLWALQRCIRTRHDPEARFLNDSDSLKSNWCMNQKVEAPAEAAQSQN